MGRTQQKTLFALDSGSTNWRLYRAVYELEGGRARLLGEPAPAPLTSFTDRSLPAALLLNPAGDGVDCYGEAAIAQIESPGSRERLRAHFKPAIGRHPSDEPEGLPYTHEAALTYTRLMLSAIVEGIRREKWRGGGFSDLSIFAFAHPVHWETKDHQILEDFQATIRCAFPESDHPELRFVSEPEAAIYSLQHSSLLPSAAADRVTLILDVGGSTTDLVASELGGDEPVFLARFGGPVGGELYDAAIGDHIAEDLRIPSSVLGQDLTIGLTLRSVARRLKEGLSRQLLQTREAVLIPQRTVTLVDANGEVYRGTVALDEARFHTITQPVHDRFLSLINHGLQEMGLGDGDIGRIVLVGGGAQLFSIVRYLRDRFGGDTLLLADDPGECVVRGVSLEYGAALCGRRPTLIFMERTPHPTPASGLGWELVSESGERIPLRPGTNRLGRAPSNELHIPSEKISRWHAELSVAEAGCSLKDLGSTNGSYLDGERLPLQQEAVLRQGSQLRFGDRTFSLQRIVSG